MRNAGRILVLLAGLGIIVGIAVRAEAKEDTGSRGTVQFQGVGGSVQAWSRDVALLQDRIDAISGEIFDPAFYSAYSASVQDQ